MLDESISEWPTVFWESWESYLERRDGIWPLFVKVDGELIPKGYWNENG